MLLVGRCGAQRQSLISFGAASEQQGEAEGVAKTDKQGKRPQFCCQRLLSAAVTV